MATSAIYARKSTESEDRQILSIESQIRELKEFASRSGLEVRHVLTEAKSAKSPGRIVFGELLRRINRGEVKHVLCWKLDRLARNPVDGAAMIWALETGALESIESPQRSFVNTGNDKFWMQLEFGMAKKYIDDLSENVKRGLRAKVLSGWMPGRAPLGYLNDPLPGKGAKVIQKDPDRFRLVRKMWDLMLAGNHSVMEILSIANKEWGFKTRFTRPSPNKPLSRSTLYKIFRDPFYCGQFKYAGELYEGHHEPMVTRAEFDVVQEMLSKPGHVRPKRHCFHFTGMMRCGQCGAMITAEEKFKLIKSTGLRRRYVYYHCTRRKDVTCRQRFISEDELRRQVLSFLRRMQIPRPYLDWVFKHLDRIRAEEKQGSHEASAATGRELGKLRRRVQNLLAMKISPDNVDGALLSDEEYLTQKNRLVEEQSRLESRLQSAGTFEGKVDKLTRETFRLTVEGPEWFSKGTRERQRAIIFSIGSNHTITNGILHFDVAKPFLVLKKGLESGVEKIGGFEPEKSLSKRTQSVPLGDGLCAHLSLVDDVRTVIKGILSESHDWQRSLTACGTR